MSQKSDTASWRYDAGEPWVRKKHRPKGAGADIRVEKLGRKTLAVATCPAGLSREDAERLLQENGIPDRVHEEGGEPPERIYAVLEGVPYEARPTSRGDGSYHAFPLLPAGWERLPESLRNELERRAHAAGDDVRDWLRFAAGVIRSIRT